MFGFVFASKKKEKKKKKRELNYFFTLNYTIFYTYFAS